MFPTPLRSTLTRPSLKLPRSWHSRRNQAPGTCSPMRTTTICRRLSSTSRRFWPTSVGLNPTTSCFGFYRCLAGKHTNSHDLEQHTNTEKCSSAACQTSRTNARTMLARLLSAGGAAGKKLNTYSNMQGKSAKEHFWSDFRAPAPTSTNKFCGLTVAAPNRTKFGQLWLTNWSKLSQH